MAKEQLSKKNRNLPLKVLGIAGLLILVIVVFAVLLKPQLAKAPSAGKAVSYGDPTTGTTAGQWGIKVPTISAGAPWQVGEKKGFDTIEVTGFVNFPQASKFSTMRLLLKYDPNVLEAFSTNPAEMIIPLHTDYTSDLGSIIHEPTTSGEMGSVLIYYTWSSSPSKLSTFTMSGQTDLFKVKFRVIAPSPVRGSSAVADMAAWLEDVPQTVSNDASGTNYGIYKIPELGTTNVQMIGTIANPKFVTLTVYPGCVDVDGDTYAPAGADKQACVPAARTVDDCNDNAPNVKPGATETCNNIDDDCNSLTDAADSGMKKELNDLPAGRAQLAGVCMNYKSCVNGQLVNSYQSQFQEAIANNQDPCDFWDNDCDGQLNEDGASCSIGSPQAIGNVYLEIGADNKAAAAQVVDTTDLTHLFILQQGYFAESFGTNFNTPVCNELLAGWVCICKNGDYYQSPDSAGTGVSFVNYKAGSKEARSELLVQQNTDGTVRLVDANNNQITCD